MTQAQIAREMFANCVEMGSHNAILGFRYGTHDIINEYAALTYPQKLRVLGMTRKLIRENQPLIRSANTTFDITIPGFRDIATGNVVAPELRVK